VSAIEITDFDEFSDDLFDILSEFSTEQPFEFHDVGFSSNSSTSSPSDDESQESHKSDFDKTVQSIDFCDNMGDYVLPKKHSLDNVDDNLFPARKLLSQGSNRRTTKSGGESKRFKQEDRLIKNREAANKSRMKRKTQMSEMEIKVKVLSQENISLQTDNAALRAENSVLFEQNNFLKSLLSEKLGGSSNIPVDQVLSSFRPSNLSGVAMLCLVCTVSFWGDSIIPSNQDITKSVMPVHHGRVLMSIGNEASNNDFMLTSPSHDAAPWSLDSYDSTHFMYYSPFYVLCMMSLFVLCYLFLTRKNLNKFVGSCSLLPI